MTAGEGGHRLHHMGLSGDATQFEAIQRPGGGALKPIPDPAGGDLDHFYLQMDGAAVFKHAVVGFAEQIEQTLAREGLKRMTLQERIQSEITDAMRGKAALKLSVLRMMKTAVKNKEIEKMKPLEEPEVFAVFNSLVKQRKDSVEQFRKGGREELAQKEEAEIKIIEQYLPAGASDDDIRSAVEGAIQETGATSPKDMGKVMKATLARLAGKTADGSKVSQMVKEKLV